MAALKCERACASDGDKGGRPSGLYVNLEAVGGIKVIDDLNGLFGLGSYVVGAGKNDVGSVVDNRKFGMYEVVVVAAGVVGVGEGIGGISCPRV